MEYEQKNLQLIIRASKKDNEIIDQAKRIGAKNLNPILLYTIQIYERNKELKQEILRIIKLLLQAGAYLRVEYPDSKPTTATYWVNGKEGSPDKCIKRITYATVVETLNQSFEHKDDIENFLEKHVKHMKFPQF